MVGRRATGKSTYLKESAEGFAKRTGKRALIIDVNNSPAYSHLPLLSESEFLAWRGNSSIRVARFYLPKQMNRMLNLIEERFVNGLLILEDCTKYISANPPEQIKSLLVDNRMKNVDLFFTFHALYQVPPFFWTLTDILILKKTQETLDASDRKRYPNFIELQKAFAKVQSSKNEYITEIVNTRI